MKGIRKNIYIILIFAIILGVVDFIPIKFAINIKDVTFDENTYICRTEPKLMPPDIRWIAKKEDNSHLDRELFLKLFGNNPNSSLSINEFDIERWYELDNAFLLSGSLQNKQEEPMEEYYYIADLNVNDWEIVYPIKRASFRRLYAPKRYLTLYDFNWFKLIKK